VIRVRFLDAGGSRTVDAPDGARLLDVAREADQPLEGVCGGDLACGTCHVTIAAEDWNRLPPPRPEEEDLLDLLPAATRYSRCACQLRLTPALDGLTLRCIG